MYEKITFVLTLLSTFVIIAPTRHPGGLQEANMQQRTEAPRLSAIERSVLFVIGTGIALAVSPIVLAWWRS